MGAWETAVAVAIAALLAANVVAAIWAGRHLRALTIVLLDIEQRLRSASRRPEEAPVAPADLAPARRTHSRRLLLGLGTAAAALVAAAIGLGALALSSGGGATRATARAIPLEARGPPAQQRLTRGGIVLVISGSRRASLVLSGFAASRSTSRYTAWVISGGKRRLVARFTGARKRVVLPGTLPRGAVVAVTMEPTATSGSAPAPLFVSPPVR